MEGERNLDDKSLLQRLQSLVTAESGLNASEKEIDDESMSENEDDGNGKHKQKKECRSLDRTKDDDQSTKDDKLTKDNQLTKDDQLTKEDEDEESEDESEDESDDESERRDRSYDDSDDDVRVDVAASENNGYELLCGNDNFTMNSNYGAFALMHAFDKRSRMYHAHNWHIKMNGLVNVEKEEWETLYAYLLVVSTNCHFFQSSFLLLTVKEYAESTGQIVKDGYVIIREDGTLKEMYQNVEDDYSIRNAVSLGLVYDGVTIEDIDKYEMAVTNAMQLSKNVVCSSTSSGSSGNGELPLDLFETISLEMNEKAKVLLNAHTNAHLCNLYYINSR